VEREQEGDVPRHLKDASRDQEGFGHGQGYLYPHAYRDHWVAQQYLPDNLQGRVFYQPSDQGYERGIRDQVARRREAQLAAMVEEEDALEILTVAPSTGASARWLQRTISNTGEQLGRLRDRVLDAAQIQRHFVVLDLNAGSGLLTWEILRRAPEGGTWALARDRQSGEGLRQQAERLPEIERPIVLVGDPDELRDLLALRGEGDLRFDAVVGRNALGTLPDKNATLYHLHEFLKPGGMLSLAEAVVKQAQRLYELVDLAALGSDLSRRVREAEEQIYAAPDAPLVNWMPADLQYAAEMAGFEQVGMGEQIQEADVLVGPGTIDQWFATESDRKRPSYAQHLLQEIAPEELAQVRTLYERELAGQTVRWRTRIAVVVGQRAAGS
ncbi:MAG: AAA family ATPase, partial [Anaerolineae bacterium]